MTNVYSVNSLARYAVFNKIAYMQDYRAPPGATSITVGMEGDQIWEAMRSWDAAGDSFADLANYGGNAAQSYLSKYEIVEHKSSPSGAGITVFREIGTGNFFIATNGLEAPPHAPSAVTYGDVLSSFPSIGINLALANTQAREVLLTAESLKNTYGSNIVVTAIGHSNGAAASVFATRVDQGTNINVFHPFLVIDNVIAFGPPASAFNPLAFGRSAIGGISTIPTQNNFQGITNIWLAGDLVTEGIGGSQLYGNALRFRSGFGRSFQAHEISIIY